MLKMLILVQLKVAYMKENLRLRKEPKESKKEIEFLKKAAAFFVKEIN